MAAALPIADPNAVAEDATVWARPQFAHEAVERAWREAATVDGNDPALWRKDEAGAWIHRLDYGRRESEFGWEIHDDSSGRDPQRLVALQWQNFVDRLASRTRTRITADGLRNARRLL